MTAQASPQSPGRAVKICSSASWPPVDAPIATMRQGLSPVLSALFELSLGVPFPDPFFGPRFIILPPPRLRFVPARKKLIIEEKFVRLIYIFHTKN